MKLLHNKFIAKLLAVILGLSCAVYFGWTFSFFGYWMGTHFQGAFPEAPTTIALACAVVMFLAVVFTFFYFEYVKEDVLAYEDDKGDGSFYKALKQLKWAVLGLEVFSLLFRLFLMNFAPIGIAMVGIGIVLMYLAHLFGKVMHAQVNVPHDVEASRVMDDSQRRVWSITRGHINKIKDVDALKRIGQGDLTPIDEVRDISERERMDTSTRALQRRKEAQSKREHARETAARYLKPRSPHEDGEYIPSNNGHSKQPVDF